MKLAPVVILLIGIILAVAPNASGSIVFATPMVQGWSLSWKKSIIVAMPKGTPSQELQDAFGAGHTDIEIDAVANADSNEMSRAELSNQDGTSFVAIPLMIKASGFSVIDVRSFDDPSFDLIELLEYDYLPGTAEFSATSTGQYIPIDDYTALTVKSSLDRFGPMNITISLSKPSAVPEPSSQACWGVMLLGCCGWTWRFGTRKNRQGR